MTLRDAPGLLQGHRCVGGERLDGREQSRWWPLGCHQAQQAQRPPVPSL